MSTSRNFFVLKYKKDEEAVKQLIYKYGLLSAHLKCHGVYTVKKDLKDCDGDTLAKGKVMFLMEGERSEVECPAYAFKLANRGVEGEYIKCYKTEEMHLISNLSSIPVDNIPKLCATDNWDEWLDHYTI